MPVIVLYLLKLSVSLAVMHLFYLLLLRRLTFYNHNRWYLVGYSLLCFFISLINISPMLDKSEIVQYSFVSYIPVMQNLNSVLETEKGFMEMIENWSVWNWLMVAITAGTVLMLVRLVIQLFSFRKIIAKARLLSADDIKLYQVDENIIPFSFGNSIFINHRLHADEELKEIIRHEFVHVKQRHTVDIIWSEILVILNWYNPFAWLIRNAIRQNLEFIADHKVVQSGMDKTQYQYLLLKVIGNNHFSITNKFNFSSLKKRITMMNKIKTAKVHLLKFMFILPLLAVVLVSFRDKILNDNATVINYAAIAVDVDTKEPVAGVSIRDEVSGKETVTDENGYFSFEFDKGKSLSVKLLLSRDGYIKQTAAFDFTAKDENSSRNLVTLVGMKQGAPNADCKDCFSSMSMDKQSNSIVKYADVKKIYDDYIKRDQSKSTGNKYESWNTQRISYLSSDSLVVDNNGVLRASGNTVLNIEDDAKGLFIYNNQEYSAQRFKKEVYGKIKIKGLTIYGGKAAFDRFGEKGKNGVIVVNMEKPVLGIKLTELTIDTIPNPLKIKLIKQDSLKDLLLKLPGLEVSDDGSLKSGGKQIDKIVVDGKPVDGIYNLQLKEVEVEHQWNPQPTANEKDFLKRHPKIDKITWAYITSSTNNELIGKPGDAIMQLHFKNGSWDMYNISRKADVEKFKKNYGEAPPIAPPPPATKQPNVIGVSVENPVRKNVTLRGNVKALYDLNGINDPLFIVDGKKMTDFELKDLEPDTIESINVLKDAKATQEYGSEARNGVIRIELKKAKEKAKN